MSEESKGENADADDIMERFPKPEEVTLGRRGDLPDPPQGTFHRPNLRRDTDPLPEGTKSVLASTGRGAQNLRNMGVGGTVGISLVVSIAVGAGLGWLVDTYLLHSTGTPIGLIVGFMLGVFSGFANLIRVTNRLNRDE